ncbi:4Fe-4S dicluster domain-containing protein [Desulfovibrio sp. OttesenSCG-928-A18]|nr:4Fe-4S dicluster domain-containing protein [Desulfovibrio sp. OttesenSCG-928-A18]
MSDRSFTPAFISFKALSGWLRALAQKATVHAPRREGRAVVYRELGDGQGLESFLRPTESAKHVLFPRSEALFSFQRQGEAAGAASGKIRLQEPEGEGPAIIFGALSCDARGFLSFDPVYDGCGTAQAVGGIAKDPYYLRRRANTSIIVRACKSALNTCFCHWVGGGPASTEGADLLATDLEGGLLLSPCSEAGAALLEHPDCVPALPEQIAAAAALHAAAERSLGEAPPAGELAASRAALLALFENSEFWQRQSAQCLSCGACTYLCPTCYCFNITDESNGIAGARLRSWDSCMSALFTLEASGHNPRAAKAARLKNRVGHKFSYYPAIHEGRFSCCGCGRCIKSCPSSVDIRKIVLAAIKEAAHV